MKVGIIGLGIIGYPIASSLHSQGHEVFSWTRRPRVVPWVNSTRLSNSPTRRLDFLIVASGNARPALGNAGSEIASTYDLVSEHFGKKEHRVIYLSSGAVYGECIDMRSEDNPAHPSTKYGFAKLAAEQAFLSLYGEDICSLRIGNVIDWDSPYGILQAMCNARAQHKMVFYGNPTDSRDYISIQDLNITISKIIDAAVFPNILNVGSGNAVQLSELAIILRSSLQGNIEISWREGDIGQLRQTKLDISKLKSKFGIFPRNPREIFTEFLIQGHS